MRLSFIFRVIGILLTLFCLSLVIPLLLSFYYDDGAYVGFSLTILITLIVGILFWALSDRHQQSLRTRDGLLLTIFSWLSLSFFAALPFVFVTDSLSPIDAWFESMSGLTTTGSTVIKDISSLPPALLFYRQFLQWIGGMGIILLAVAILPILGVGGMQLYRSEIPGPVKDNKLTPRITETAKFLWLIYIVLTLLCATAYKLAGMSFFDAIAHSFSTVSIGGFSTYNDSFHHFNNNGYNSVLIQWIAIVFMMLSAMNFALHFYAWRKKSVMPYVKDSECLFFFAWIGLILFLILLFTLFHLDSLASVTAAIFQGLSIVTTTGFTLSDYNGFPFNLLFFLFVFAMVGACTGSAGGGVKVIRFLLIIKQGYRECKRVVHPHGVFNVRLRRTIVSDRILEAVWGFGSVYLIVFFVVMSILLLLGVDHLTAWSATLATINNLGPGLGSVADNYANMEPVIKLVLAIAMLVGRLEVFTVAVLLLPITWR